jgi:5-methylcytosine-specific restriction enzyme subunit McrC
VKVPVKNVYYLLLYAWQLVGDRAARDVAEEGYTELQDLFAHVLADTVGRLLARGLDRDYVARDAAVPGVRGKLEMTVTLKSNYLANAQTHCTFDELEYDVLHNRILRATLTALLETKLHSTNAARIRKLHQKLDTVADVRITSRDFRRVQLHRNNALYEFAMRLCELIHENLMIDERTGAARFRQYEARQQQMGTLFQAFVREFFVREQQRFAVSSPQMEWFGRRGNETALLRLPRMETDIVLESPERRIVLDTKFYADALVGRGATKKVIAEHLYQVFAYVRNRDAHFPGVPHEGMLLYPVVKETFAYDYELMGHRFFVRSLDLDKPWEMIHEDLLALLS